MSQLVARPGRNAARQAKRLKEIRKVKAAIVWHEQERKKRQKIKQEWWDTKQSVLQRKRWEREYIKGVKDQALKNAKEDWQLGPLRPNRAIGGAAEKYGALTAEQMQQPEIPTRIHKSRNERRQKKGLEVEYPLVVDDKKYFPIVKDDRVVVLKEGRDKYKIGVVQEINDRTHHVIVKGVNMQYIDSAVFGSNNEGLGPRHESEVPIPIADVRLVIPYELTWRGQERYEDVIVEKILMERHTTGVDPYTDTDYGDAKIPDESHHYDPRNGLPIFHRYIAGTRHRIEWPWERDEVIPDSGIKLEDEKNSQDRARSIMGTIRHPITSLKRRLNQPTEETIEAKKKEAKDEAKEEEATIEELESVKEQAEKQAEERRKEPHSKDPNLPEAFDLTDTSPNAMEDESMQYTILTAPLPDTLGEELRTEIHDIAIELKKDPDAPRSSVKAKRTSEQGAAVREAAKERKRAAERMKTPMQLRWELEHAKKLQAQKKSPLVETDALLAALGLHMQKNGVKVPESKRAEEVD